MTIRSYLWGMRMLALAALAALAFVVFYINPERDGLLGKVFFYASLFFSVTGLATLFLFWLRKIFLKEEDLKDCIAISFREGALIGIAVCGSFILQSFRMLVWWDAGILVAGALLIELWFLSR